MAMPARPSGADASGAEYVAAVDEEQPAGTVPAPPAAPHV
jgi:hypothetical protein